MEYIWSLEEELEDSEDLIFAEDLEKSDWLEQMCREGGFFWDSPEQWFVQMVEWRAMELWQGEQVDGSTFKFDLYGVSAWTWPGAKYFMDTPSAVMAGYRYLLPCCKTLVTLRGEHYRRRWSWPKSLEIGHSAQCILVYAPTSAQDKIV